MNEAQVRTVEQVRQVLEGTQALLSCQPFFVFQGPMVRIET